MVGLPLFVMHNYVEFLLFQLETVEEGEEETKKKKKKKHKKEKKRKDKEREETDKNVDEIKEESYETKLNNINLPPNIQGQAEKPEPAKKLFTSRNTEIGPVGLDDSGTDNMPSPQVNRRHADTDVKKSFSPNSKGSVFWSPRRHLTVQDISDDENAIKTIGLKKRLTQERMQRYISSDSENEEEGSRRFSSQLKNHKKKKSRFGSDTE